MHTFSCARTNVLAQATGVCPAQASCSRLSHTRAKLARTSSERRWVKAELSPRVNLSCASLPRATQMAPAGICVMLQFGAVSVE